MNKAEQIISRYKLKYKLSVIIILFVAIYLSQCTSSSTPAIIDTGAASFDLIQDQILTPNCATAGCHASEADASYKEHKLVLVKGKAYNNLVGKTPQNPNAVYDNLKLVSKFKSAESLLYHKLTWNSAHHGGKSYGSYMPLGSTALYVGQIEYIRRWIEAGAPQTGDVADISLLADRTASVVDDKNFTPLEAPAAGTGYQMKVEKFEVAPNYERELFVRKALGNTTDIYVNAFKLKSRANSHHMVVYDFRNKEQLPLLNQVRDLRNPDNTLNLLTAISASNHVFMAGGSDASQVYSFPEGTAMYIPANATLDLNPHYFNKTKSILYGENYVNFYTTPKEKVQNVVKMLDLGNQNIPILPGQRVTHTKNWTFNTNRNIVMLTSHTHKLGEKFEIRIKGGKRDGELVYETDNWEHPLVKNFDKPIELLKGEGLTSHITYYNPGTKTVSFGLTSEDEMGIIFGYYYEPK
jgi:hypothetical protein